MEKISNLMKHPKELVGFGFLRIFTEFFYFGIRIMYVDFSSEYLSNSYGNQAKDFFSYFIIAVGISSILGAIIGDLKFGNRKTAILGLILSFTGMILLLFIVKYLFFLSLALIALGEGFYISNFNAQLGKYYLGREKLIDGGFTIIHLSFGLGYFLSNYLIGYFRNFDINLALYMVLIFNLLALFIQLKIKEHRSDENFDIAAEKSTNWRIIILMLVGIIIYKMASGVVSSSIIESIGLDNYMFYGIISVVLVVCSCIIWSKYYLDLYKKIATILILVLLKTLIVFVLQNTDSKLIQLAFYPLLILRFVADVILIPLVYSIVIKNTKPKYFAIGCSLSFFVTDLINEQFAKNKYLLNFEDPTIWSKIMSFVIIFYLLVLYDSGLLKNNKLS